EPGVLSGAPAVAGRAGDVGHCASLGVSGRSASVERRATFVAQVSVTCQGQLGRAGEPLGTATPRTRAHVRAPAHVERRPPSAAPDPRPAAPDPSLGAPRPAPERAATRLRWAGRGAGEGCPLGAGEGCRPSPV